MANRSKIDKWTTPAALLRIRSMSMRGLTQQEICTQIGVPYRTFKRWLTKDPNLKNAVDMGREASIAAVENALFKKAQSGDLGAICFFLKNRAPEAWSDHPELRGADAKVVFIDDVPKVAANAGGPAGAPADGTDNP